ncbi:MAG: hypothetical protein IT233_07225 [Bacteroidia bacterium]|nr:hypothetical protein [Bacteroidia bacterium]
MKNKLQHLLHPVRLLLLPYALLIAIPVFSQDDFMTDSVKHPPKQKKEPFWSWDKVEFGGSLGASFGNVTFIDVSPTIGYRLVKNIVAGAGPLYNYFHDKRNNIEINIYGGRTYVRPYIYKGAFLHGELEWINGNFLLNKPKQRFNVFGLLAGGGFQPSPDGGFFVLALWELLHDPLYPYPNPIFRMGFTIGI